MVGVSLRALPPFFSAGLYRIRRIRSATCLTIRRGLWDPLLNIPSVSDVGLSTTAVFQEGCAIVYKKGIAGVALGLDGCMPAAYALANLHLVWTVYFVF